MIRIKTFIASSRDQNTDVFGFIALTVFTYSGRSRVKPLGTIIQCFPHVEEETRSILQSVMDEAENCADFAEQLCNKACSEKVPPGL